MGHRVVVTGLGLVTPVGTDVESTWSALLAGRSGAAPIAKFDPSALQVRFACEVKGFDPLQYIDRKEARRLDLFAQFALAASHQAVVQAGLDAGTLVEAINAGSGRNAATLDKFPKSILPGTFDYGGPVGLMLKDLSLFIEEAGARGLPAGMAQAAFAGWSQAVERVGADADYSELIRPYEDDAGVQVRWRANPP